MCLRTSRCTISKKTKIHRKNGGLWYRTYAGVVNKGEPVGVSTKNISITLENSDFRLR